MAITYIKLGPIGDAFSSKELGLYLVPDNASEIDENILNSRLIEFTLTGFIVKISKLEYDNIKLLNSITTSGVLNSVPVGQPFILEPVEDAINTPIDSSNSKRYLIAQSVPGVWMGKRDFIAQSNGIDWNYTTPLDGMILPVYNWGISLHYSGTYPSGKWDIPQDRLDALTAAGSTAGSTANDFQDQINKEIINRSNNDTLLQQEIDRIIATPYPGSQADNVTIKDVGTYYNSNTVEGALQEIGLRFGIEDETLQNLQDEINNLINAGTAFQFLYGTTIPDPALGANLNVYLNISNGILYKKDNTGSWLTFFTIPIYAPPLTYPIPIGTASPIVLDWTSDILPYKAYGNNPKLIFRTPVNANTDGPEKTDIYYELTWADTGHGVLNTVTIKPQVDMYNNTIDNLNLVIIKQ